MSPEELRNSLKQQPFEPFRIVMTDGVGYDIRHPDFLLVGARSAVVGVTNHPDKAFFDHSVKVDLLHIIRLEPLSPNVNPKLNGAG